MKPGRWLALAFLAALPSVAMDPCGLVPPIAARSDPDRFLTRKGDQLTYVFFKDGVEDIVLRPEFEGRIAEFGMLIPFPTPPAIRKIADDVFSQVENAANPPTVSIDLAGYRGWEMERDGVVLAARSEAQEALSYDAVRVVREEAVGMYQVAVLEAGSADALRNWMTEHGYMFPTGMEAVCQEYVEIGWCFVAEKARVGRQHGVEPTPGMTGIDFDLPPDATFSGALQAMGFRFRVEHPVVMMRLGAFNPGPTHNIVYALTDEPIRFEQIPDSFVRQQISGEDLLANLTEPLPMVVNYYDASWQDRRAIVVPRGERPRLPPELNAQWEAYREYAATLRDPARYNGKARELFASDLLAARHGRLIHPYEERQKELLNIGEELGLRGPHVDELIHQEMQAGKQEALAGAIDDLRSMTLTVIEGDFPREVIRDTNLTFARFSAPAAAAPPPEQEADPVGVVAIVLVAAAVLFFLWRKPGRAAAVLAVVAAFPFLFAAAPAQDSTPGARSAVAALSREADRASAVDRIVALGSAAVDPLADLARNPGASAQSRGWAMVALARIADARGAEALREVLSRADDRPLVRLWAAGALGDLDPQGAMETLIQGMSQGAYATQELIDGINRLLLETIGPRHADALLRLCLRSGDMNVRRTAAGYLGSAGIDSPETRRALLDAVAFDPERAGSEGPAWTGGPLFIPGVAWTEPEGREFTASLIQWLLWFEAGRGGEDAANVQILHNNLWAIGSAQGLQPPNGDWNAGALLWLRGWCARWALPNGQATTDAAVRLQSARLLVQAIEGVGRGDEEIHRLLAALAGQDLGSDPHAWRHWLEELESTRSR